LEGARAQTAQILDIRITEGADDVVETPGGALSVSASNLILGTDGSDPQLVGLRFTGVAVPQGAEIAAAWVEFTVDEASEAATDLTIVGVAETDAAPFGETSPVSSRAATAASVSWSPDPWLEVGSTQTTPDLSAIVAEVVGLSGWAQGNSLAVTFAGTGSRVAESLEGFPAGAPLLHVEYVLDVADNTAPEVSTSVSPVDAAGVATLSGSVNDDGLPEPSSLGFLWSQTAGPAAVIDRPSELITTVTLSDPGTYQFTLDVTDGELSASDSVIISLDAGIGTDPLLPDLVSVPTGPGRQKYTIGDPTFPQLDGRLLLRFDGYVTNVGDGPLHVTGNPQHLDPDDLNSHDVWQWVEQTDGTLVPARKVPIKYETDDDHNHFHFMELIQYDLLVGDGSSGETAVTGSKVGFCLVDGEVIPGYPDPGPQTYVDGLTDRCQNDNPTATQLVMGVTEGWQDRYSWETNFQWFDVSEIVPGPYRIQSLADPADLVIELDEFNPPVLAPDISVVPGYAPAPVGVSAVTGAQAVVVLASTRFDSPQIDAPAVGSPVYSIESLPAHGVLDVAVGPLATPVVEYTPDPGFTGTDTFVFGVRDATSPFPTVTPTADVTITVEGTSSNQPPQVEISATPGASADDPIALSAQVIDDGQPDPPAAITWEWAQTSGPVAVIENSTALDTSATPAGPGVYVFSGTADDGEYATVETVTVILDGPVSSDSAVFPVVSGADDVEEYPDGELYVDSSDLELVEEFGESQTPRRSVCGLPG
jgi:hypothetical protein